MIYNDYDSKTLLPEGIIMEVVNDTYWGGDLYVKTSYATWGRIGRPSGKTDDQIAAEAKAMVQKRENNVSPNPSGDLKVWFRPENVDLALAHFTGSAERGRRLQYIINSTASRLEALRDASEDVFRERRGN